MSKKVLVVDDDPDVRLFSVTVLEENGYTPLEAENGEEGLKMINAAGFGQLKKVSLSRTARPVVCGQRCIVVEVRPPPGVIDIVLSRAAGPDIHSPDGKPGAEGVIVCIQACFKQKVGDGVLFGGGPLADVLSGPAVGSAEAVDGLPLVCDIDCDGQLAWSCCRQISAASGRAWHIAGPRSTNRRFRQHAEQC